MLFKKIKYTKWSEIDDEANNIEHLHFDNQFSYHLEDLR